VTNATASAPLKRAMVASTQGAGAGAAAGGRTVRRGSLRLPAPSASAAQVRRQGRFGCGCGSGGGSLQWQLRRLTRRQAGSFSHIVFLLIGDARVQVARHSSEPRHSRRRELEQG
jgi:hypothetical protein